MIQHNMPCIGKEESDAIAAVINSKWITRGQKVKEFESMFAKYIGTKYAVATNSGTTALFVALKCLGINHNQKVIIPTYACTALTNAVFLAGGMPQIVDITKGSWNLRYNAVDAIKDKSEIKAMILSHTFGAPGEIEYFKRDYNIPIIEDCAQALGSQIGGTMCGNFGDIAIFSFAPSKMITTGAGGMIVTNNEAYYETAIVHTESEGWNNYYAMNDIQAAMGIEQLKKLPEFLRKRKLIAQQYMEFCRVRKWKYQEHGTGMSNWYRFVLEDDSVEALKKYLMDIGIKTIVPIREDELLHNLFGDYLGLDKDDFPVAEKISRTTLSLPIYPEILGERLKLIINALEGF